MILPHTYVHGTLLLLILSEETRRDTNFITQCQCDGSVHVQRNLGIASNIHYMNKLFQFLQHLYPFQYLLLTGLLYLSGQDVFIQNGVHAVEVKNDVELTNVGKVAVQKLHEQVDGLQVAELVVGNVHGDGEEQTGVSAVDELVGGIFDEVGVLLIAGGDEPVDLGFYPGLLGLGGAASGAGRRRDVPD